MSIKSSIVVINLWFTGMMNPEYEFKDSDCFADSGKVVLNLITLLSVDNI